MMSQYTLSGKKMKQMKMPLIEYLYLFQELTCTKLSSFNIRIRVGRSIQGFGLSPGITKEQRVGVEKLMSGAFAKFSGKHL